MRLLRLAAAAIAVFLAGAAAQRIVIEPYRTNLMKQRIESDIMRLLTASENTPNLIAVAKARRNIDEIQRALQFAPADVDLYMELAAEWRVIGGLEQAAAAYRAALRYNQRPEIFRNLAEVETAMKDFKAAAEHYGYAIAFAPEETNYVPDFLLPEADRRAAELRSAAAR